MKRKNMKNISAIAFFIIFTFLFSIPSSASVNGTFLYTLSNFNGSIPYQWGRVVVDRAHDEIYVIYQSIVTVFNENGMEIYRFGEDINLGQVLDLSVERDGDIFLLCYKNSLFSIIQCNYRGEPKSEFAFRNLPPDFSKFAPSRMIFHEGGNVYFFSHHDMKAIITDRDGNFKEGYDLANLAGIEEKDKPDTEIIGFSVDKEGNLLFTIPVLFLAYKVTPDKQVFSFGKPGGAPGKFGIIAGILSDDRGNILITDKLKCVVGVYDKNFNFINAFGYRGLGDSNLIAPDDIAIDSKERIYVSQARKRGVSVFKLSYE